MSDGLKKHRIVCEGCDCGDKIDCYPLNCPKSWLCDDVREVILKERNSATYVIVEQACDRILKRLVGEAKR
jgi:hypothetical protein